jgi:serine kinase of HPr protein (carbohydrate metabolism regulator)
MLGDATHRFWGTGGFAVMLMGKSRSGKSDIALQLIGSKFYEDQ